MKSILQKEKECYYCKTTLNLEEHHCLYGTANRRIAERFGLKVWLCSEHHRGRNGVHGGNKYLNIKLKQLAQSKFEESHTREDFIKIFGKNYL